MPFMLIVYFSELIERASDNIFSLLFRHFILTEFRFSAAAFSLRFLLPQISPFRSARAPAPFTFHACRLRFITLRLAFTPSFACRSLLSLMRFLLISLISSAFITTEFSFFDHAGFSSADFCAFAARCAASLRFRRISRFDAIRHRSLDSQRDVFTLPRYRAPFLLRRRQAGVSSPMPASSCSPSRTADDATPLMSSPRAI